jgi:hypothetical protein
MKRLLLMGAVAAIVVPASASPDLQRETGVRHGTYDLDSGTFTPSFGPLRYGDSVWALRLLLRLHDHPRDPGA